MMGPTADTTKGSRCGLGMNGGRAVRMWTVVEILRDDLGVLCHGLRGEARMVPGVRIQVLRDRNPKSRKAGRRVRAIRVMDLRLRTVVLHRITGIIADSG